MILGKLAAKISSFFDLHVLHLHDVGDVDAGLGIVGRAGIFAKGFTFLTGLGSRDCQHHFFAGGHDGDAIQRENGIKNLNQFIVRQAGDRLEINLGCRQAGSSQDGFFGNFRILVEELVQVHFPELDDIIAIPSGYFVIRGVGRSTRCGDGGLG